MITPLQAAEKYTRCHWPVTPVRAGEKAPHLKDWPQLRISEQDLPRYFGDQPQNIGLLLGAPSEGLVDVDLDVDEAVDVARLLLPPTGLTSGRTTRPRSHYWYEVDDPPNKSSERYIDPTDGRTLVELRSTGAQTLVPPSIHPDGDRYHWDDRGTPARVEADELRRAVRRVAVAALLARHWTGEGGRHEFVLALAGHLLRRASR